jgi:23S rRNA pseudouridine1911/1915/1917 synthase
MTHIRHPLVGDRVYGWRPRPPPGASPSLTTALQGFPRQALHAIALGLSHPETGESVRWEIPMAEDMLALLRLLGEGHDLD